MLTHLLETESDATKRAILGSLLARFYFPATPTHDAAEQTLTALLAHWLEAEQPPAPEAHAMQVAVNRAVAILGDLRVTDVDAAALRRLADGMATAPYQKQKQPLHRSGREATRKR